VTFGDGLFHLVGHKLGTKTDRSTQKPPPGQDIFILARTIFRKFWNPGVTFGCKTDFGKGDEAGLNSVLPYLIENQPVTV
jgi:hypothetical protein